MRRLLARAKGAQPADGAEGGHLEDASPAVSAPFVPWRAAERAPPPSRPEEEYPTYGEQHTVEAWAQPGKGPVRGRASRPMRPHFRASRGHALRGIENVPVQRSTGAPIPQDDVVLGVQRLAVQDPREPDRGAPPSSAYQEVVYTPAAGVGAAPERHGGLFKQWRRSHHGRMDVPLTEPAPAPERRRLFAGRQTRGDTAVLEEPIRQFCAAEPDPSDWQHVHELGDVVNQSESNCKEAARLLRKELKHGTLERQRRAIRLWAVWSLFAGTEFSAHAANSAMMSVIEEMMTNPMTAAELRDDLLDILAALTYRSRSNTALKPVARLWGRVRPEDRPPQGEPLRRALFSAGGATELATRLSISSRRQSSLIASPPQALRSMASTIETGGPLSSPSSPELPPLPQPLQMPPADGAVPELSSPDGLSIADIQDACSAAHVNTSVLLDALASEGLQTRILPEFSEKVQLAEDALLRQLPWITELAEEPPPDAPEAVIQDLLSDVLQALGHLSEATTLIARLRRQAGEEEEENRALERSVREMRRLAGDVEVEAEARAGGSSRTSWPPQEAGARHGALRTTPERAEPEPGRSAPRSAETAAGASSRQASLDRPPSPADNGLALSEKARGKRRVRDVPLPAAPVEQEAASKLPVAAPAEHAAASQPPVAAPAEHAAAGRPPAAAAAEHTTGSKPPLPVPPTARPATPPRSRATLAQRPEPLSQTRVTHPTLWLPPQTGNSR